MENKYSTDFDFQAKLQAAISGELNDSDKEKLKALIDGDKGAKDEYIFSEKLSKTLKNQDVLAVSALIGNIIDAEGLPDVNDAPPQYSAPTKAFSGFKAWFLGIAAVTVIGIGAYGVYLYEASKERSNLISIANKYLQSLENDLYTQTFKQGMSDLDAGMSAYNIKDYAKAVTLLGKHYKQTSDEMVGLYLGISMLLSGAQHNIEAEQLFSDIKPKLPPPITHVAEWYLILAKLSNHRKSEAVEMLKNIPKDSPYYSKSGELLYDLAKEEKTWEN